MAGSAVREHSQSAARGSWIDAPAPPAAALRPRSVPVYQVRCCAKSDAAFLSFSGRRRAVAREAASCLLPAAVETRFSRPKLKAAPALVSTSCPSPPRVQPLFFGLGLSPRSRAEGRRGPPGDAGRSIRADDWSSWPACAGSPGDQTLVRFMPARLSYSAFLRVGVRPVGEYSPFEILKTTGSGPPCGGRDPGRMGALPSLGFAQIPTKPRGMSPGRVSRKSRCPFASRLKRPGLRLWPGPPSCVASLARGLSWFIIRAKPCALPAA